MHEDRIWFFCHLSDLLSSIPFIKGLLFSHWSVKVHGYRMDSACLLRHTADSYCPRRTRCTAGVGSNNPRANRALPAAREARTLDTACLVVCLLYWSGRLRSALPSLSASVVLKRG